MDYPENHGSLNAFTYIEVTDLFGNKRLRRVLVGRDWNISLEKAKETMVNVREANSEIHVHAEFKIGL